MTNYEVDILSVAGTWVGALATFVASGVALFIALRADQVRLEVAARPMQIIVPGVKGDPEDVFLVSVTNVGRRSALITHVLVDSKLPRWSGILTVSDHRNPGLPTEIKDGQQVQYIIPAMNERRCYYDQYAEKVRGYPGLIRWLSVSMIRFSVQVSVGKRFVAKRSPGFVMKVLDRAAISPKED